MDSPQEGQSQKDEVRQEVIRLNYQALELERERNYEEALKVASAAGALSYYYLGEYDFDHAVSLNNIAGIRDSLGSFDRAETLYMQSLNILEEIGKIMHPQYAMTLNNLAALYKRKFQFDKADQLYQQALEIIKNAPDNERNREDLETILSNYEENQIFQEAEQRLKNEKEQK